MSDRPSNHRLPATADLAADLRQRSVGGGAATMAAQAVKFALTLGSTAILARMLSPEDFGLIAGVVAFTGFFDRFKDLGLPMSTVQREEISHRQVSTLFWINTGLATVLAAIAAVAAPLVAWFYKDPATAPVTVALAATVLLGGLSVQHQALLRRGMQFKRLAALEVTALFLGNAAGIAAAAFGAGYWSLVILSVVQSLVTLGGVWLLCPWRPCRPGRGAGVRPMLAFGGYLSAMGLLQHVAKSLDKMLVGRYCGAGSLGVYSKAWQLLLVPVQQLTIPLTGVATATLSRLQGDATRYRAYFDRGLQTFVFFSMPLVVFMFVAAEDLVLAVLGPEWIGVVPVYRALAPVAMMSTFNAATGWVYLSWGHTDRQFRWAVLTTSLQVIAIGIGISWGVLGVAVAFSIATVALRFPGVAYCFRGTPLHFTKFLAVIARPAAVSMTAGGLFFLVRPALLPAASLAVRLALDMVAFTVLVLGVWMLVPGGRKITKDVFSLLPVMLGRPSSR